jgi:hypothetical protein
MNTFKGTNAYKVAFSSPGVGRAEGENGVRSALAACPRRWDWCNPSTWRGRTKALLLT